MPCSFHPARRHALHGDVLPALLEALPWSITPSTVCLTLHAPFSLRPPPRPARRHALHGDVLSALLEVLRCVEVECQAVKASALGGGGGARGRSCCRLPQAQVTGAGTTPNPYALPALNPDHAQYPQPPHSSGAPQPPPHHPPTAGPAAPATTTGPIGSAADVAAVVLEAVRALQRQLASDPSTISSCLRVLHEESLYCEGEGGTSIGLTGAGGGVMRPEAHNLLKVWKCGGVDPVRGVQGCGWVGA